MTAQLLLLIADDVSASLAEGVAVSANSWWCSCRPLLRSWHRARRGRRPDGRNCWRLAGTWICIHVIHVSEHLHTKLQNKSKILVKITIITIITEPPIHIIRMEEQNLQNRSKILVKIYKILISQPEAFPPLAWSLAPPLAWWSSCCSLKLSKLPPLLSQLLKLLLSQKFWGTEKNLL